MASSPPIITACGYLSCRANSSVVIDTENRRKERIILFIEYWEQSPKEFMLEEFIMAQKSVEMRVEIIPIKVASHALEDILTELTEVIYSGLGLFEQSKSTVVGTESTHALKPTNLSFSEKRGNL